MSKIRKIVLVVIGGFVVLLVVVAFALLLLFDTNAYKPGLEATASDALEMQVSIGGRLGISFVPGLRLTLADVRIRNRGTDVASAEQARLRIDLLPLLRKEVRIRKIALKHPRISIERDRDGKLNVETPQAAGGMLASLGLSDVSISDATLLYADKQSGKGFAAAECGLEVHRLRLSGGSSPDVMKSLSFTAELACGELRRNDFRASDLKVSADGTNGIVDLKPVTMRVFGVQGSGSIQSDFSGAVPLHHVRYSLSKFHVEEFFKTRSPQKVAEGLMDLSVNLNLQGKTVDEMRRTAEGQISLRGADLTLIGRDLDRQFSRFESSQNFNLVDVGAFFFAGPFGLVVTKGYDFAGIFQESGGSSKIRTLVSDWKVEHGVAHAQDVAMATSKNRIALQGGLDFVNERFDDVTFAVIDARGCAEARQRIRGTFDKPVIEPPSVLASLTGPALRLLNKGTELLPGGECEVFYAGSVVPPQ